MYVIKANVSELELCSTKEGTRDPREPREYSSSGTHILGKGNRSELRAERLCWELRDLEHFKTRICMFLMK